MSADSFVFGLPLLGSLGTLINWLLLLNALLIGMVVFFAHKASANARRARELEERIDAMQAGDIDLLDIIDSMPPPSRFPLSDDRPIPLVKHPPRDED